MSLECMNCLVLNFLCLCRTLLNIPTNFIKVFVKLLFVYWTGLIAFACLIITHENNLKKFFKGSTEIIPLPRLLPRHHPHQTFPKILHQACQLALLDKDLRFLKSFCQASFHKRFRMFLLAIHQVLSRNC